MMKLETRIFLLVSGVTLFAMTLFFLGFDFYSNKTSEDFFINLVARSSYQASINVQKFLHDKTGIIQRSSQRMIFSQEHLDEKSISKEILDVRNTFNSFEALEYLDSNFNTISHTSRVGIGELSENNDVAIKALKMKHVVVDFVVSAKFKRSFIRICEPIFLNKKIKGFVIGYVPFERITEFFSTFNTNFGGYVKPDFDIVLKDGSPIYRGHSDDSMSIYKQALEKMNSKTSYNGKVGEEYVFINSNSELESEIYEDWYFIVHFNSLDLDSPLHLLRNIMLLVAFIILLLCFLIIRKTAKNILKPLILLDREFSLLSAGKFKEIDSVRSNTKEFQNLIIGFNFMVRRLTQSMAELTQKSKFEALGQMAAGVAHEINNPLAIIKGHAEKLSLQYPQQLTENQNESVSIINSTVDRISKIIHSLRSFSREGGGEPFEYVDVKKIIEMTLDLCSEKLKQNRIELRLDLHPQLPVIECRPIQISQVLLNLISNSYDAVSTESETKTERWIRIQVYTDQDKIQFRVSNSGTKISLNVAEKIFQPFFTTKSVSQGTGLGLSISKGIAESHHGKLNLDLTQKYTEFVLEIPIFQTTDS
jgi:signal transduction histidine kinase